jgi:hypothetical protein
MNTQEALRFRNNNNNNNNNNKVKVCRWLIQRIPMLQINPGSIFNIAHLRKLAVILRIYQDGGMELF